MPVWQSHKHVNEFFLFILQQVVHARLVDVAAHKGLVETRGLRDPRAAVRLAEHVGALLPAAVPQDVKAVGGVPALPDLLVADAARKGLVGRARRRAARPVLAAADARPRVGEVPDSVYGCEDPAARRDDDGRVRVLEDGGEHARAAGVRIDGGPHGRDLGDGHALAEHVPVAAADADVGVHDLLVPVGAGDGLDVPLLGQPPAAASRGLVRPDLRVVVVPPASLCAPRLCRCHVVFDLLAVDAHPHFGRPLDGVLFGDVREAPDHGGPLHPGDALGQLDVLHRLQGEAAQYVGVEDDRVVRRELAQGRLHAGLVALDPLAAGVLQEREAFPAGARARDPPEGKPEVWHAGPGELGHLPGGVDVDRVGGAEPALAGRGQVREDVGRVQLPRLSGDLLAHFLHLVQGRGHEKDAVPVGDLGLEELRDDEVAGSGDAVARPVLKPVPLVFARDVGLERDVVAREDGDVLADGVVHEDVELVGLHDLRKLRGRGHVDGHVPEHGLPGVEGQPVLRGAVPVVAEQGAEHHVEHDAREPGRELALFADGVGGVAHLAALGQALGHDVVGVLAAGGDRVWLPGGARRRVGGVGRHELRGQVRHVVLEHDPHLFEPRGVRGGRLAVLLRLQHVRDVPVHVHLQHVPDERRVVDGVKQQLDQPVDPEHEQLERRGLWHRVRRAPVRGQVPAALARELRREDAAPKSSKQEQDMVDSVLEERAQLSFRLAQSKSVETLWPNVRLCRKGGLTTVRV